MMPWTLSWKMDMTSQLCRGWSSGPIWTKFGRQMQNDMPTVTQTCKSKVED